MSLGFGGRRPTAVLFQRSARRAVRSNPVARSVRAGSRPRRERQFLAQAQVSAWARGVWAPASAMVRFRL
jgi:hypothetical protein